MLLLASTCTEKVAGRCCATCGRGSGGGKEAVFLVHSQQEPSQGPWGCSGEDFKIDLRMPPFELEDYLHYYDEHTTDGKGVLLYDIKKLRKTNWKAMRTRVAKLQDLPSQRRLLKTIEHTRGT